MRNIILVVLVAIFVPAVAISAEILLDVDFAQTGPDLHKTGKGSFDGPLPVGCSEDFPAWNTSVAGTNKMTENGKTFIRFDVKKLDGLVLFRMPDPKEIKFPGYYKVIVECRCPDAPLNLHIRQLEKPYRTFWEEDIEKNSRWVERTCFVSLESSKNPVSKVAVDVSGLWLYLSLKSGITDIASIKLAKISKDDYMTEKAVRIARPEKGSANFFRNSRFPLGMPSGWSINREMNDGKVEADSANPGPSGVPSLKIQLQRDENRLSGQNGKKSDTEYDKHMASAENQIRVYSEPFQTDNPEAKLQISFAYKTMETTWRVSVGGASKALPASSNWQTFRMAVTPDPLAKGFSLIIAGKGTLNIDSLMAYSGEDERGYASAGDCEIALAPVDSEMPGTRIQFIDEPATVKFSATGDIAGAILKTRIVNVYGGELLLPDAKLSQSGTIDFGVFTDKPFGQFRVEVWAERDGKRISPFNEVVITRIRRPVYWGKDAPDSPFGGHFFSNRRVVSTMKAAGMNWIRFNDCFQEGTCWGWVEPEKGKWQFQDEKVANYRNGKLKILGYIGSAPTWASYYSGGKSPMYFDLMYQPKDIESFKNYVRTVARHYEGVIDEYQFQNEPWGGIFWHKSYDRSTGKFDQGLTPARDYAELSKIAYEELKQTCPDAKLYGFNTTGHVSWTDKVFDAGAYAWCDMIDYHVYTPFLCGYPDDQVAKTYEDCTGYIRTRVKPPMKPVVMSEGNGTRGGDVPLNFEGRDDFAGMYKHTIPWKSTDDYTNSADMNCRFILSHLALGVKRIFLYSDHCYSHLLSAPTFPVLLAADGYPHPSLVAFSNMAWQLEDRRFVKCIPVGKKVWAYLFEGRGRVVAVISGERNGQFTFKPDDSMEVIDLFGNLVTGQAGYKGNLLYVVSTQPLSTVEQILQKKSKIIDNE